MTSTLQKAFDYYLSHQDEIVSKYNGKFVVIRGQNVIGVYDAELKAIQETQKKHQAETFLVQFVSSAEDTGYSAAAFEAI